MRKILNFIKAIIRLPFTLADIRDQNRTIKTNLENNVINNGRILSLLNMERKKEVVNNIKLAEFKIFSQWGDDGIIQFLVNYLDIKSNIFIEFGVESYVECNTRFLLINNNWKGLIIDGSPENINKVKGEDISWKYDLTAINTFVTKENINDIFIKNNFTGEIGLLHIDIDGNDYWIWNEISVVDAIIVIVEYNSVFGFENSWTIPYDKDFIRNNAHKSNLYYGTSLLSLVDLAETKGYSFIGCNSNGNNAYFVKNDYMKDLKKQTISDGFVDARFAESRGEFGELTFMRGAGKTAAIKGMPVYNTRNNSIEYL